MIPATESLPAALANAIRLWAETRTNADSQRWHERVREKTRIVTHFFAWIGKPPHRVAAADVADWRAELERRGLAPVTVYNRTSCLSSFYNWAMTTSEFAGSIRSNPVDPVRPSHPTPYQSKATQPLDDQQVEALLQVVKDKADTGDLVGKRDYALLLLFLATGWRRQQVFALCWGDVEIGTDLIATVTLRGGDRRRRKVPDPRVKTALLDYLEASGRLQGMQPNDPLWTSHDYANTKPGAPLSSRSFAKNLKRYARQAGIGEIHLHQTRHTYARRVTEEAGSLSEIQEALDNKSYTGTWLYVQAMRKKQE